MWDSNNSDSVNMKNWLEYNTGSRSTYSANVQVGTTAEPYQEDVLVGYEQLGTTTQQVTKKTITGYTCSCGTTLSVSQYVNQYGTPSGYHMSNGILVED